MFSGNWHEACCISGYRFDACHSYKHKMEISDMKWETPKYEDVRFGFEITLYVFNR